MFETYDKSIGYPTVLTGRKIVRLLFLNLRAYDITPEQWTILRFLGDNERISQKELSEVSGKDQPTVTRILNIMDRKEWISRVANDQDRRSFFICLTERGRNLLEHLRPVVEETFEKALAGISAAQMEGFKQILKQVNDNLDDEFEKQAGHIKQLEKSRD